MHRISPIGGLAVAAIVALCAAAAFPASSAMKMAMPMAEGPSHFPVAKEVYTSRHLFRVDVVAVPKPIPFETYFTLRFAIYDGHNPEKRLPGAEVTILAGMRHGLKHGFAHGMQSSPKVSEKAGFFTVKGLYFHMMGPWTLKTTVRDGAKEDVAYIELPCCGK
jgi:hypothetical protein